MNFKCLWSYCVPNKAECPQDQECFKFFCYPKNAELDDPLKSCTKNSECNGTETPTKCLKKSTNGVCVSKTDYEMCESHEDCYASGGKCCSDYCCNEKYHNSLNEIVSNCEADICKVSIFYVEII